MRSSERSQQPVAELHSYAPHYHMQRHSHDCASISFILAGSMREQVRGAEQIATVGSIGAKDVGIGHETWIGSKGGLILCLRPASAYFASDAEPWRWLHGTKISRLAFTLVPELVSGDVFGIADEQLHELSTALTGRSGRTGRFSAPRWAAEIRDWIHADPLQRPSVQRLADRYGVHPVYLSRAFRAAYGQPIGSYARRVRALVAASMVTADRTALVEIAHDLGFADQSHFNRVFRLEFGIAPSEYRKLVETNQASALHAGP